MDMISSEINIPMEELINVACEQALKKLTETNMRNVKKTSCYKKETGNVSTVEKDTCTKLLCATDSADCQKAIPEEDVDSEDEPKIDPKLLLIPTVFTTKLDHMGLFNHKSFNYVDSKELIDLVYMKSNPLRKNIVTSEKDKPVESIVIDTSDDDNYKEEEECNNTDKNNGDNGCNDGNNDNENNGCNDAANYNMNNYDVDDIEFIESNISEAKRDLLSSNLFKDPQIHNYNHLKLMKNPDFEKTLRELNIDVNALVNSGVYSNDDEDIVQHEQDTKDPKLEPCTSKGPTAIAISRTSGNESMKSESLITSPSNLRLQSNEATENSERNRAVNLPNISEVRRFNQKLLTAEVPPIQNQKYLIQIPKTNIVPNMIQIPKTSIAPNLIQIPKTSLAPIYPKIAPNTSTTLTGKSKTVINKRQPPPLIMFPQHFVSAPSIQADNVPKHNVMYTVSKANVQTSSATAPKVFESEVAQNIQCTCSAKQFAKTTNGNIVVKTNRCSVHNNFNKIVNSNDNVSPRMNNVQCNNRVLSTEQNVRVTSEPTPQNTNGVPQNISLTPGVQLLVLPTGEMAYVIGPNADFNGLSCGAAIEPNRFVFSVNDNSSQSNSVPNIHDDDGVNQKFKTTPTEQSNKLVINNSVSHNENRLYISVVDVASNKLESDNQNEVYLNQLATNKSIDQNESHFSTSVVNNKPSEFAVIPNINMDQPTSRTPQTVPGGTVSNIRIKQVQSINKMQDAKANNCLFYKMNPITGDLIPYNRNNFTVNTASPKPMTIDLTDDDEQATENPPVLISRIENVLKAPNEKVTEQKSLQMNPESKSLLIKNPTRVPEILKSVLGKDIAKQNKSFDEVVAKQYFRVVLGQDNVQGLNTNNDNINKSKGIDILVDSHHNPDSNIKIQSRKRNSESAKLSSKLPLPKIGLLKPLVSKEEIKPEPKKINKKDAELDTSTEKQSTSGWVLLGL